MTKHIEILAGGLADELFRNGLANDRNMLAASALVHPQHHSLVVQAHERFIEAGATLILTSNSCVVPGLGFTVEEIREYTRLAGRLAAEARERAHADTPVKICGSLPALMPSYRSDRTIERQRGRETYQLIGEALWPFVDMFIAEPMSSLAEAKLALEAVEGLQKPVMVAFALNSTGELRSGEPVLQSIQELLAFCDERASSHSHSGNTTGNNNSSSNTDAEGPISGNIALRGILFGCSQAEDIAKALHHVRSAKGLFTELKDKGILLGGYADRISPMSKAGVLEEKLVSGAMHSAVDMEVFASFALRWVADGADIVGGCCGVPPDYLTRIRERVAEQQPTVSP